MTEYNKDDEYVREWSTGGIKYKQRRDGGIEIYHQPNRYVAATPVTVASTAPKTTGGGFGLFSSVPRAIGRGVKQFATDIVDLNTKGYTSTPSRNKKTTTPAGVRTGRSIVSTAPAAPGAIVSPGGLTSPVTVDELLASDASGLAGDGGYQGEEVAGVSSWQDVLGGLFGLGGGGGGGGGMSAKEQYELQQAQATQRALNRYARGIQQQLDTGSYRTAQDDLLARLGKQYSAATPIINQSIDSLRTAIEAQTNPYAGLQAQVSEVSPQLSQLLESQGLSTDALGQFGSVLQAQAQERGNAYNEMAKRMAALDEQSRQRMLTGAESQRANLLAGLEAARAGYGTQIESQATEARRGLEQMLLDAIAKGANPKRKKGKGKK